MSDSLAELGNRLRKARESRGMTLRELAAATDGYIANLSSYEKGRRVPPLELFTNIARTLGVSADYLLGGTEEESLLIDDEVKESVRALVSLTPKSRALIAEIINVVARRERNS